MKSYSKLVDECRADVDELFPWDLIEEMQEGKVFLLLDVRETDEFKAMHIADSLNVPRGILESAVEWNHEDTAPELVQARECNIVVICRSGNRSLLAARSLKSMGFKHAISLRTGVRGWNDYEQPLVDMEGKQKTLDEADDYFTPKLDKEQLAPDRRQPT